MAALKAAMVALALAWCSPAAASLARWQPYIAEASARFGVPESWIRRVMRAESGGRTMWNGRPITSRAGAMGLMQVMPATYRELARTHGLGGDPHDPRDNILAGTAYLRAMYERFGHPGLFGAYNAGPGRYAEYLGGGRPLPAETRAYLERVAGPRPDRAEDAAEPARPAASPRLFFELRTAELPASAPARSDGSNLFIAGPASRQADD